MQVKRFEAPTIQEALETIKRELGPEAIILQTKKNRRGFGLLSKASVEVTAAVSERSMHKKQVTEKRLPEDKKNQVRDLPADKQADVYNKYVDRQAEQARLTKERVEFSQQGKRITATRYIDIPEEGKQGKAQPRQQAAPSASLSKALSNEILNTQAQARSSTPPVLPPQQPQSSAQPLAQPQPQSQNVSALEQQFQSLKQLVEEMKTVQETAKDRSNAGPLFKRETADLEDNMALEEAFEQLVVSGVERRYALAVIKKMKAEAEAAASSSFVPTDSAGNWNDTQYALDCLAEQMMNTVGVVSPLGDVLQQRTLSSGAPIAIALVGATGVGKTTTLAKIASEATGVRNLKIGLVNLDHQRVGAFDQLATYAKILGVPFRSASSAEDLQAILSDFQGLDLILVDAAGYSQRDSVSIKQLQDTLGLIPNLNTYLVLSATTREPELYDTINRFSVLGPKGLVLSKLDEAVVYGSIYNVTQKSKLPLGYFTTGQTVPGDIEEATRERVVALIMDI